MRKLIPFIVGGVIVLGGTAAFFMAKKDEPAKSTTNSSQSSARSSAFTAVNMAGQSFRATISTQAESGGQENRAVMEADAKTGAVSYQATTAGEAMKIIYTKEAYYMCQAESCVKYALGQGTGANFSPDAYQYDEREIESFKKASTSLGRQSCPAGTCDVWKVSSDGSDAKVYVDTKTKRISQVTTEKNGATSKVVYEYTDVSVTIPTNAQEVPNITLPSR